MPAGGRASIADSSRTALGVHVDRLDARGRVLIRALPQCHLERLDTLTMLEFAFSIFVESSSIAIAFGHTGRLAATGEIALYRSAHPRRCKSITV